LSEAVLARAPSTKPWRLMTFGGEEVGSQYFYSRAN